MFKKTIAYGLVTIGLNVLSNSKGSLKFDGSKENARQLLAGVITTGIGVYSLGTVDGYQKGYKEGYTDSRILGDTLRKYR